MKKNNIIITGLLGLFTGVLVGCTDAPDEITEAAYNRNFSPVNLEAKNISETSATLAWTNSKGADQYRILLYANDSLTFQGEPQEFIVTENDNPFRFPVVLDFDTKYTATVEAITTDNASRTSKPASTFFRTSAKQFMKNPKPVDIADRSVIISWEVEEGYDVSQIVIGNVTHDITDEEREACKATVEGLEPETTYTAYLYYNGKECGKRDFTTIADLEGAILVHEGDDLKALIEEAQGGEVFALYGGKYPLNPVAIIDEGTGEETGTAYGAVKVNASITIKGIYPTDQPVLKGRFELYEGAGLSLSQVVIDATANSTLDQVFNYKTEGANYGALDIQNCEIVGKKNGKGLLYLNVAATVEAININNSIVKGIECESGDFIDSRKGYPKAITLTNSTFNTVATGRDFIRVDDASGSFEGATGPVIVVDHCTLYNVGTGAANYRLFYPRFAGNKITFTNNIVTGFNNKRGFANQSSTDQEPTLSNNYYWECQNLTELGESTEKISWFDVDGIVSDPQFADPDNGDFTLGADAPARKGNAGDPRWCK